MTVSHFRRTGRHTFGGCGVTDARWPGDSSPLRAGADGASENIAAKIGAEFAEAVQK